MSRQAGDSKNPGPPALVITVASSGVGHATAKLAISLGWRVFGSVRSKAEAEALKDEFETSFTPLLFDVRDQPAIEAAAKAVRALLGPRTLNGLVNNAGVGLAGPTARPSTRACERSSRPATSTAFRRATSQKR
jgi:NADP-dependent 3-hydroxy acid dehydrogenase YdfG